MGSSGFGLSDMLRGGGEMSVLFMETTQIETTRTVSEIQQILGKYGATKIVMDFVGSNVDGIAFMYPWEEGREIPFKLPCRWREIESILRRSHRRPKSNDSFENWARRVAWRQILRWVQAQMALVETNMVKVQEVFLPYVVTRSKETFFEVAQNSNFQLEFKK